MEWFDCRDEAGEGNEREVLERKKKICQLCITYRELYHLIEQNHLDRVDS